MVLSGCRYEYKRPVDQNRPISASGNFTGSIWKLNLSLEKPNFWFGLLLTTTYEAAIFEALLRFPTQRWQLDEEKQRYCLYPQWSLWSFQTFAGQRLSKRVGLQARHFQLARLEAPQKYCSSLPRVSISLSRRWFSLKFKVSKIQKVFQHAHGWHIRPRRNGIWSKWLIISCPSVNCYLAVCHTERDHDPSLSDDWEFGPRLLIISTHCSYPSCPTLQLPIFKNHSWLPQIQIL